jgi:glycosyltransferase involved in cell wall biosynthesis
MRYITNHINEKSEYKYTICTACYNSSLTINKVYESINKILSLDFEWIIIDDFSTDDTLNLLKNIAKTAKFNIKVYSLSSNNMVTYCYNLGVKKAKGDFFILLDHDDEIKLDAFDRFEYYWNIYGRDDIVGIMSNCMDSNNKLVGTPFPSSPMITGFFEMIFDHKVRHEKFFCYRAEIMKMYNFPLIDRYVPESTVMWNISADYKTIFINESLRVYNLPEKGGNNLSLMNVYKYSLGFRYKYLQLLNNHSGKFSSRPYIYMSFIYNYAKMSVISKKSILESCSSMNSISTKLFVALIYPIAKLKVIFSYEWK